MHLCVRADNGTFASIAPQRSPLDPIRSICRSILSTCRVRFGMLAMVPSYGRDHTAMCTVYANEKKNDTYLLNQVHFYNFQHWRPKID